MYQLSPFAEVVTMAVVVVAVTEVKMTILHQRFYLNRHKGCHPVRCNHLCRKQIDSCK
jgi:hypothetical protein